MPLPQSSHNCPQGEEGEASKPQGKQAGKGPKQDAAASGQGKAKKPRKGADASAGAAAKPAVAPTAAKGAKRRAGGSLKTLE